MSCPNPNETNLQSPFWKNRLCAVSYGIIGAAVLHWEWWRRRLMGHELLFVDEAGLNLTKTRRPGYGLPEDGASDWRTSHVMRCGRSQRDEMWATVFFFFPPQWNYYFSVLTWKKNTCACLCVNKHRYVTFGSLYRTMTKVWPQTDAAFLVRIESRSQMCYLLSVNTADKQPDKAVE